MGAPVSDTVTAFQASFSLLGRSANRWLLPVVLLSWFGAIPEVMTEYYLTDILSLLTGPGDFEAIFAGGALLLALVLLAQLVLQLVALLWAFLVLADMAAGREVNLRAGLRRTLSWRLQFSWLLSLLLVSVGTSLWWIGGCILLLPYGLAVVDAYETDSGMSAFGRSVRLGLARSAGNPNAPLAWPIVSVSTLVLAAAALLSCGASCVSFLVPGMSAGPSLIDLANMFSTIDLSRPDELLPAILHTVTPEPNLGRTVSTLLLAPKDALIQVFLLALPIVVYHHAIKVTAGGTEGDAA